MIRIDIADLFCGAGGTSTGALEAVSALGFEGRLTAINHWDRAIQTHTANHPSARHRCTGIDEIDPRKLYKPGELDLLWASPECTNHSNARRKDAPINDQSRATAFCVTRWAEALRPPTILVENVPAFLNWGPLDAKGRKIKARRGEIFRAWITMLEAIGYAVEWRIVCAADFGDPTSRRRLIIQAQLQGRKCVWPNPTYKGRWRGADKHVIDWSIPAPSIFGRKRPLKPKTIARINAGLEKYGAPVLIAMEHGGRVIPLSRPVPTVTCAKGGAFGIAYTLPQGGGGILRPASKPVPTVATDGAIALIVEYYGNGVTHLPSKPLPTVTCRDRFALVKASRTDVGFRMFKNHELALAQGFRRGYKFAGNGAEVSRQIGNAVPRRLARAIVAAALSQKADVRKYMKDAA